MIFLIPGVVWRFVMFFESFKSNECDVGRALVALHVGKEDFYLYCLGEPQGPSLHHILALISYSSAISYSSVISNSLL